MGTELERAIPPELAREGVSLVQEANGFRAITIPPAVRATHNVLMPTESFAKASEFYSPSINRVFLNAAEHGYERERGKYDLSKNGLLALADAAGIEFPHTERIQRDRLMENEIGWQATVTVRRMDGTRVQYTGSRIVDLLVEREKTKQQCIDRNTGVFDEAYFFKRWAQERDVADAKCETKAILRAVAMALKINRGPYTKAQFERPWVVVSYVFTPDYTDPEVRRMAMERGYDAQAQVFSHRPVESSLETAAREAQHALPQPRSEPPAAQVVETPDPRADEDEAFLDVEEVPYDAGEMPSSAEDAMFADDLRGRVFTFGKHKGKTWGQVADEDASYLLWLAENANDEQMRRDATRMYEGQG